MIPPLVIRQSPEAASERLSIRWEASSISDVSMDVMSQQLEMWILALKEKALFCSLYLDT